MAEPDFVRRTRSSYDALADDYAEWIRDELAAKPLDRAVLGGFAELVRTAGVGPVADVGCGSGRVTAHLAGLGLSVFGIDLSPRMVAAARRAYPGLRFSVGSMTAGALSRGRRSRGLTRLPLAAAGPRGGAAGPGRPCGHGSRASPTWTATSRKDTAGLRAGPQTFPRPSVTSGTSTFHTR
ncbi:methyltransferase domain-containing protein [Actinosynnema sp. CS-041913]|uniref:methyltransferase domain-containing protein n=1 Tax=Actinosynnema sp. CS-041913 TaxID=3239917 RepID=UPI003D8D7CEF